MSSTIKNSIVSINMVKVICAYLVVAIHVHPFEGYNQLVSYIFTQIIPRFAVPFFFVTSGYFYFKSLLQGKNKCIIYIQRLIFTYSIWSIIFLGFKFLSNSQDISVKSILINYLFYGTEYHLWYFPALIFCVITATIIYKLGKIHWLSVASIILYFIGLLGCSYYQIGQSIPLLGNLYSFSYFTLIRRVIMMGLPFFMGGYFIHRFKAKIDLIKNKKLIYLFSILLVAFIGEICTVISLELQENIIITIFLYPLTLIIFILCLKNPLENLIHMDKKFKIIANFTYYSHPLFITIISVFYRKIFGIILTPTLIFIGVIFSTTVGALIINQLNIKWLNKIVA